MATLSISDGQVHFKITLHQTLSINLQFIKPKKSVKSWELDQWTLETRAHQTTTYIQTCISNTESNKDLRTLVFGAYNLSTQTWGVWADLAETSQE